VLEVCLCIGWPPWDRCWERVCFKSSSESLLTLMMIFVDCYGWAMI